MIDDDTELRLTKRGKTASLDGLHPETVLLMEIMKRLGRATDGNVQDLFDELLQHYGSAEAAIMAIKSGEIGFEKV